jgi:hypothetical protein
MSGCIAQVSDLAARTNEIIISKDNRLIFQKSDEVVELNIADFHSGSPYALYPNKQLQLKGGNISPNPLQSIIYRHFVETCDKVRELRKGKRLIIKVVGDAVEGIHHATKELITPYCIDQKTIHLEIMTELMERVKFSKGDTLYYVDGTPAHAGETEYAIADDLGAIPFMVGSGENDGLRTWPIIKGKINGVEVWTAHHGSGAGAELARGNALRNKLREIYYGCKADGLSIPRVVVMADRHEHRHERFERKDEIIDGFLLPAWKVKDGYIYKISPFARPSIGALVVTYGKSITWQFLTMDVRQDEVIKL